MYLELNERDWGLWSHASWREMVVGGGYLVTTAFFSYVMGNLGNECSSYSRGFMTLAVGFFVPYTAVQFPKLQKANEIKSENLGLYKAINQQVAKLEEKYDFSSEETPSEERVLFTQLISVIKTASYNCLNITLPNLEKNSPEHLIQTQHLLTEILERVNQFANTLPNSAMQFDKTTFEKELIFWKRDPQAIHNDLIIAENGHKQVVGFR